MVNRKTKLKETLGEVLDIGEDIIMDLPRITLCGNRTINIENHKGIMDYAPLNIKIRVSNGFIEIAGENLVLKDINREEIILEGNILKLNFVVDEEEE